MSDSCIFTSWKPAVMEFCEAPVFCFPKFPVDTLTNMGPLIAGILIVRLAKDDQRLKTLGWSAIATAIFSAFFHGSGTNVGEYLDLMGMHAFIATCLAISITSLLPKLVSHFGAILSSLVIVLAIISFANIDLATPAFAIACLSVIALEFRRQANPSSKSALYRGTIALGVAYSFWLLDYHHILCVPTNHLLTGHGIWHLLCGYVFYCSFIYYRDKISPESNRSSALDMESRFSKMERILK